MKTQIIAAAALILAPLPALAHVVVTPATGAPGAIIEVGFKAGHGCGEAKTTSIRIEAPADVPMIHPMDAKGWTLKTDKTGTKVTAATWTAGKDADTAAALPMHVQLPAAKGPVYFTAIQSCGKTVTRWDESPKGKKVDKHPAPSIDVGGAPAKAGAEEHHH